MAKKKSEFEKKSFESVGEAVRFLEKKQTQKEIKRKAKAILGVDSKRIALPVQLEQQRRAGLRRRGLGFMAGRAESLELEAVNFSEIPLLEDMERQRTKKTMISSKSLMDLEKSVTDSFPG